MQINAVSNLFSFTHNPLKILTIIGLLGALTACGGNSGSTDTTKEDGGSNRNLAFTSSSIPSTYKWGMLALGSRVYIDRTYTYSTIPAAFIGLQYLQTANNDKASTSSSFLTFQSDNTIDLYVGHANPYKSIPSWLSTWEDTGEVIITTDRTLYVFKKTFSPGTITLGGNTNGDSMYVVLLDTYATDGGGSTGTGGASATLEISASLPTRYKWNALAVGSKVYSDRPYTYTNIPAAYTGAKHLQTANSDKTIINSNLVSFTVNQTVDVFVGHVLADTVRPSWLNTWEWTGDSLNTTDRTLNLYKKTFLTGTITLPGNESGSSMYVVIVTDTIPTDGGGTGGTTGGGTDGGSTELTITSSIPLRYQWGTLAIGSTVYSDRTYTFSSVPAAYLGVQHLKTANSDKAISSTALLSFAVNKTVDVYVGHVNSDTIRPSWLSTWESTGETVVTTDRTLYLYKKTYSAGTVSLPGNEIGDSMYIVLLDESAGGTGGTGRTGGTGGTGGTATPFANDDTVSTGQLTSININILNNDTGLEDAPLTVSIIQSPSYGTASIDPDNSITYNPDGVFSGVVTIIYSVTDMDGDITIATITVNISCATCASGYNLTYEWSPNLAGDSVIGYRIYTGSTIGTANTEISNTLVSSNGFTASAPSISYDAWNDLALKKGDTVCFRVKAYNEAGLSGFSTGICDVIPN